MMEARKKLRVRGGGGGLVSAEEEHSSLDLEGGPGRQSDQRWWRSVTAGR
jgi:hypothetical protein